MNRSHVYYLFCLFISLVVGCSENSSRLPGTIPKETFIRLYIDVLIAGESSHLSSTDSAKTGTGRRIIDSLYAKHGVTDIQVRQTIEEYNKDLNRWKEFYDEVTKRLEAMQKDEQSKKQL